MIIVGFCRNNRAFGHILQPAPVGPFAQLCVCRDASSRRGRITYTHLGLEDAVEEMSRMQDVENARKEQEKLMGKQEETKMNKRMFRVG